METCNKECDLYPMTMGCIDCKHYDNDLAAKNTIQKFIDSYKGEINGIHMIIAACDYMEWSLAIPKEEHINENDNIKGLIIGEENYVSSILDKIDGVKFNPTNKN